MENKKIEQYIIEANNSKLKYISLIAIGFSVFVLFTDYIVQGVWRDEFMIFYKLLDIAFATVSVLAVSFFWLIQNKNLPILKAGIFLFPLLILNWAAAITGIDFSYMGFSTFIIVVLSLTFFLYINLLNSIIYLASSCLTLLVTLYLREELNDNYLPLMVLAIPTVIISILITTRNYSSKLNDLFNNDRMAELNLKLQYSNQNLEKEIEIRTREILIALEKAEESDRLKSSFLANLSHEIRTPMNGILGFAELLKEPDLTGEEQNTYIQIIEKNGARMLSTINDIVDLSKIQSGILKISISEINIHEKINEIYTLFKLEAELKGLQFYLKNTLPTNQTLIKTDSEKLSNILSNLVRNAIKFTKTGSIEIGVDLVMTHPKTQGGIGSSSEINHLLIETADMPVELRFYVSDTGIGIHPDQKEIIFERFRQGNESLNKHYQGAGLGLAISKAYIEMLGGKIWVESQEGFGSTFYFTLPYPTEQKTDNSSLNEVKSSTNLNLVNNLKILVVEDDESSNQFISITIQKFAKEIINVSTGIEAVETCRKNPDIDLILMDIQMPEMDGYEAISQIRKFNSNVIIIAQTAYALSGDKEKAIEAGCNDYISKPIIKEKLLTLVQKYFMTQNNNF